MNLDSMDTYAAAFAAVFGGIGVKILEKLMSKRSEQFLEATAMRDELRKEAAMLRRENDNLRTDRDEWRTKYYDQVEENLSMNQQCESFRLEIQRLNILQHPSTPSTDNT